MYFLGGSPEFNNFHGLLKNIDGLQMHVEGSFSSPKMNVWGISDKNLFLEANKVFKQQAKTILCNYSDRRQSPSFYDTAGRQGF
jgi:hypothetical protein